MVRRITEEPIVPKPAKSFIERTGAVMLVTKPASYVRSLADLGVNIAGALAGPVSLLIHQGVVSNWEDLGALPIVAALTPTVVFVVRQWLGRAPGDVDAGRIRDAIRGKG